MTRYSKIAVAGLAAALVAGGCTSVPSRNISSSGPTITNAHIEKRTIELNQSLQPKGPAGILADVKDFSAPLTEVKLKFTDVPIEVAMRNVGGSTWRAELSHRDYQVLAIRGKTVKYDANVVATDEQGRSTMTSSPLTLSIKAPEPPT